MKLINALTKKSPGWYDALEANSTRYFYMFAAAQLVLWTLIPALVFTNLPLDVIELLSWGHEWQLGYSKHPPAPAWILEALAVVSKRGAWTAYFASQVSIVIAYWAIWKLGRETIGDMAALLAVLATSLIYYFNFPTIEFNHNVLQIPVWALLGLFGWRALRDDRWADWLLVGLFAGLSIYIKYSQAIMVLTLFAFVLVDKQARTRLKSAGLWVAIVVAVVVALPHLIWMYNSEFQSLFYATGRSKPLVGLIANIVGPLKYLLAQIANHGGLILVVVLGGAILPMDRARGIKPVSFAGVDPLARRYILWIALVPVLFTTILSMLLSVKFRSMWGAPMLSFSALALVLVMKPLFFKERFGFMAASWAVIHVALLGAIVAIGLVRPHFANQPSRTDYPGGQIGAHFNALWQEQTGKPLSYVDGDEWIGGNIAYYAADRPSQVQKNNRGARPWIDPQSVRCKGVLVVWPKKTSQKQGVTSLHGYFLKSFANSGVASFAWGAGEGFVLVGWAIVAPDKGCK